MNATLGPCDVHIEGMILERESFTRCKVTALGESPNGMVKLYLLKEINADGVPEFTEFDQLVNCSWREDDNRIFVEGDSYKMMNELKLPIEEARVSWTVVVNGCEGCG